MLLNNLVATDVAHSNGVVSQELTATQKQRLAYLKDFYTNEQERVELVLKLEPKGENSWKLINDKLEHLLRANPNERHYYDALYDAFEVGRLYTSDEIVSIVGMVRRDCEMRPYISSLRKNCEHDFYKLFIVKTVYHEVCCEDGSSTKLKKVFEGYIPTFRLKSEDN